MGVFYQVSLNTVGLADWYFERYATKRFLVITGTSGVGKDTLRQQLINLDIERSRRRGYRILDEPPRAIFRDERYANEPGIFLPPDRLVPILTHGHPQYGRLILVYDVQAGEIYNPAIDALDALEKGGQPHNFRGFFDRHFREMIEGPLNPILIVPRTTAEYWFSVLANAVVFHLIVTDPAERRRRTVARGLSEGDQNRISGEDTLLTVRPQDLWRYRVIDNTKSTDDRQIRPAIVKKVYDHTRFARVPGKSKSQARRVIWS